MQPGNLLLAYQLFFFFLIYVTVNVGGIPQHLRFAVQDMSDANRTFELLVKG